jgi:hypothetical protein
MLPNRVKSHLTPQRLHTVIQKSQLLLGLILSLLLIAVGLIGFGKRPALTAM